MGLFDKLKAYLAEEEPEEEAEEVTEATEEEPELDLDELDIEEESEDELPKKTFSLKKLFAKKKQKEEEADEEEPEVSQEVKNVSAASIKASEAKAVQDFCEQLVDVSTHIGEINREYALVTRYLTDIQRIEELPVNLAEDIIDTATKIEALEKNRQTYMQSEKLLSPEQYNVMATYEDDVIDAIKNLNEMEMREGMLKNDMGYLEGEKEDLKYMRNEYSNSIARIRGIVITILIMFLLTNAIFFIYAYTTKNDVMALSLFSGAVATLAFAIAFVDYQNVSKKFKENEAKIKRAVSLQNKVKAKYINNVNTVDYIYAKYGVNSSKELEYLWEQYNTMVRDAEKFNKTNNNLQRFCNDLVLKLNKIGLDDPDVWTKQTSALVDRREMVEIKHGLNVRRQKLRDNMVTCEKIKSNAITALNAAMEENPGISEFITKQLSPYGIKVE